MDARLLEDRLGELGPRAVPLRGDVPDAWRELDQLTCRFGKMTDVGWRTALVVDDCHFFALGSERKHRSDEVLPSPTEEPGAADDPALAHFPLTRELGLPVDGERSRHIGLEVRLALPAVEDVVRRVADDRCAERDDVPRSLDVHASRFLGVAFRPVDVGPGRSVQNEPRLIVEREPSDVELFARARVSLRKDLGEGSPELPAGAGDQETLSRSDKIGDLVLQSSTTRGSSQGIPYSSGSAGSYSSVTW